MRALVYEGPRQLSLQQLEIPELKANEVLVKVSAVGICGSELEGYLGHSSIRIPPLVMGHEFSGEVVKTGSQIKEVVATQKVVVNPLISCQQCRLCKQGWPNRCLNRRIIGIHSQGAFAEYVAVPVSSIRMIPEDMNMITASLAEPLAVCIHALKLGVSTFTDVIIFGAGPIGLLSLQVAINMGASNILVVDRQPVRLQYAEQLGALTCMPEEIDTMMEATFPNGIDTMIDCVGVTQTRDKAIMNVNPGGAVILVGLGEDQSSLSMNHVVRNEISLIGSYTYSDEDFEQAVKLLSNGKINHDGWIVSRELEEGPASFEKLITGQEGAGKIILCP